MIRAHMQAVGTAASLAAARDAGRPIFTSHEALLLPYEEALARRGAFVQFDNLDGQSDYDVRRQVGDIQNLIRAGFLDHLLLSMDICVRSQFKAYGGIGYDYLPTVFLPLLREAGIAEEQIQAMTVENPRRALTGED